VDTQRPTVSISASRTALNATTNTSTITLDFSEVPTGLTWDANDVTVVGGGSLSGLTPVDGNPLQYNAIYTAPADVQAGGTHTLQVKLGAFTDAAGNTNAAASNTLTFGVDSKVPVDPVIALRSDTLASAASNAGIGSNSDGITNNTQLTTTGSETGATVEYRIVKTSDSSEAMPWKSLLDYNDAMGSLADGQYTVYVRQTDAAGNVSPGTSSIAITKDTAVVATTTPLSVSLTSDTAGQGVGTSIDKISKDGALTVTGGENGAQTQYKIGSGAWTNNYETANLGADGVKTVQVRQVDAAGNTSDPVSFEFTLDTTAPALTIRSDRTALKAGESATITFSFSEDPGTGFTLADLVVQGGDLTNLSTEGTIRTATFAPTAGSTTAGRIALKATVDGGDGFTDAANNANAAVTALDIAIDTIRPTVAITEATGKTALKANDTASIVFTFSEDPGTGASASFTLGDITVSGGTLSNLVVDANDAKKYTALFTPTPGSNTAASIGIASERFQDAAGNTNTDGNEGNNTLNLAIDTVLPVVAITASASAINAETATSQSTITFTFSEDPGATFALPDDVVVKNAAGTTLVAGTDYTWGTLGGAGTTRTATISSKVGVTDTYTLSIANSAF
jgi:large repetitive protein